jgi:uncharacterized protein YciI
MESHLFAVMSTSCTSGFTKGLNVAYFAVTLEFTDDLEKRLAVRPTHREYLKTLLDAGKLVESGPFTDDSGALLVYEVEDLAAAEAQLANDPYTPNGIIANATIKEWNIVTSRHGA